MERKKIELLAPAGDFTCLHAAIDAGADAVYFGIKGFNMREGAKNFDISDLDEINEICGNKVKKYLTLNTIMYDSEIKDIENIISKVKGKVDAIICWDLGIIELCKKHEIPFHISTQASISNSNAASFYKNLGAERVVLARELSLEQIKEISKITGVECFIHGAMCVSISGRCFTSQFLCNKSANRGRCLQFCRRSYKIIDEEGHELKLQNNRVMSAKDLCALPFIEKLKKAGIVSFKIEGRNRSAEYVKTVVSVYRKALDSTLSDKEIEEGLNELKKVYNRGFSSGFYLNVPGVEGFSDSEDGEATEKKLSLGKIVHYWPKVNVAAIKLTGGDLKVGDEIYVRGTKTGIKRIKIESMEIDHEKVNEAKKGQNVGVLAPGCRQGDEVFLIEENN